MKATAISALVAVLALGGCDSKNEAAPAAPDAAALEAPLLPVTKGDTWSYDVHLEIPAGVTSPGAAAVDAKHTRVRTYLGKVSPAEGLPAVDCFEVIVPASAPEPRRWQCRLQGPPGSARPAWSPRRRPASSRPSRAC